LGTNPPTRARDPIGDCAAAPAMESIMSFTFRTLCRLLPVLWAVAFTAAASGQTAPNTAKPDLPRFLVYFDEFSANLSDEAKTVIADAAKRARESGAKGIVVQARASATGKPETNKYLAQTRSSIVTDQLEEDGIARTMIRQEPIGQTGSGDPSVYNRRVDIILER
jgi:OmpA-OmpF porin, OOP family